MACDLLLLSSPDFSFSQHTCVLSHHPASGPRHPQSASPRASLAVEGPRPTGGDSGPQAPGSANAARPAGCGWGGRSLPAGAPTQGVLALPRLAAAPTCADPRA